MGLDGHGVLFRVLHCKGQRVSQEVRQQEILKIFQHFRPIDGVVYVFFAGDVSRDLYPDRRHLALLSFVCRLSSRHDTLTPTWSRAPPPVVRLISTIDKDESYYKMPTNSFRNRPGTNTQGQTNRQTNDSQTQRQRLD